jgi:ketosteroid isomerase-like protein
VATDDTRTAVSDLYDAYVRRDLERVKSYIHDDINWVIYAPRKLFGFTGPKHGKQAVLEALGAIAKEYAIKSYAPKIVLADGDRAAVISDVTFAQRSSGRVLNFRIADVMRLRDGQIIEFEEFIDTIDVAEQALGRFIDLG